MTPAKAELLEHRRHHRRLSGGADGNAVSHLGGDDLVAVRNLRWMRGEKIVTPNGQERALDLGALKAPTGFQRSQKIGMEIFAHAWRLCAETADSGGRGARLHHHHNHPLRYRETQKYTSLNESAFGSQVAQA